MDAGGTDYIERIRALSEEEEIELLDAILTGGYDQGCFLRPGPQHLLSADDPEVTDAVIAALAERGHAPEASAADPFETESLQASSIEGEDPGYVILTQRCDLVRPLVTEPFVELAFTKLVRDKGVISEAEKNSPRLLFIAGHPDGGWVADLRRRAVMPKDCLRVYPALQPIDEERLRKRFKIRVGHRYTRDALPDDIGKGVHRPLVTALRKNATNMAKAEPFSDLIAFRKEGKVEVLAVYPPHVEQRAADDAWQELEDLLPDEVVENIIHEDSGAISIQQLSFWRYFSGWKLDLGEVTYHRKASDEQSPPTPI